MMGRVLKKLSAGIMDEVEAIIQTKPVLPEY